MCIRLSILSPKIIIIQYHIKFIKIYTIDQKYLHTSIKKN